jgi:hippurate hydrolase
MASEDFGCFGTEWQVPAVYWFFGGDDPAVYAKAKKDGTLSSLPTNHNPAFAPVIHPTLETGVKALVVAANAWLAT